MHMFIYVLGQDAIKTARSFSGTAAEVVVGEDRDV